MKRMLLVHCLIADYASFHELFRQKGKSPKYVYTSNLEHAVVTVHNASHKWATVSKTNIRDHDEAVPTREEMTKGKVLFGQRL